MNGPVAVRVAVFSLLVLGIVACGASSEPTERFLLLVAPGESAQFSDAVDARFEVVESLDALDLLLGEPDVFLVAVTRAAYDRETRDSLHRAVRAGQYVAGIDVPVDELLPLVPMTSPPGVDAAHGEDGQFFSLVWDRSCGDGLTRGTSSQPYLGLESLANQAYLNHGISGC